MTTQSKTTIKRQQVICTLTPAHDGQLGVEITFEPGIAGSTSPELADFTEGDHQLQGYAAKIANHIIDCLKPDSDEYEITTAE